MDIIPASNLPEISQRWGRVIQQAVLDHDSAIGNIRQDIINNNKSVTASMGVLQQQINALTVITNTLLAYATVAYGEFGTGVTVGVVGFGSSPVSVGITSPTGRVEIGFGGALNNGQGYFVYQVVGAGVGVIIDRAVVQANIAQRVAISGGASFTPSGFNTVLVDVPADVALTISLEIYSGLSGTYFAGGSIRARVAP